MKRFLSILSLLQAALALRAQDTASLPRTFAEAKITIDLPNNAWHFTGKQEKNNLVVYVFKRDEVRDSLNRSIIPNIGVIIENVADKMDVVTYSAKKRGSASFDVTAMFIAGDGKINFVNAVGYKGTYTDAFEHIVYVVHAINNKKGIQIILDTTTGTFDQIEPEFFEVLRSIRKSKEPPKPS
ncbi:MAG: hypothetical protein Q8938_08565 [Bacteroidota bacterium]|nr:hypothetical protein [Bacteroidota bacterium]MDP4254042.1 hypothetical protein [Bacteroidota bacterium]MDP4257428.1 hypothetical protein [Bacteroidota bacterium]